ncbi:hypothetical protein L1987_03484 [Smallanthus sonchifolius]|uniref:Uncharacterized protein n=1 Tax=Smallanthus sonchifolius TaxID=185202 RepID=A0ACB9KAU5_9ASTR|nr:hypothetical protein L1987_03484 [Smallanthus sonchifolius]
MANPDINNPDDKFSTYHNLVAYLVKGKRSEGFNDMIDFQCRSKIHVALTVNPTVYISHMEDSWNSASYSTEQGIPQVKSKVDGKDITVTEATLRKHIKLLDEGSANSYPLANYMRTFVSIGYTGNQQEYIIEKALLGPPWKYLCHTLLQCISQNSTVSVDTDPTPSTSKSETTTSASIDRTLVQPTEGAQAPSQDDVPSPNATIKEVLIDLAANVPSPSSSSEKVHSGSIDKVNIEGTVTTSGPSIDQEDSDNITKTPIMATQSEDVSFETLFTERNPRSQENQGDGEAEARPKAYYCSKDSTFVDEDRLKLENLEITERVALLEAEVSKLRHQVSMHESHRWFTMTSPSLVSVGTQIGLIVCTDANKKGKESSKDDKDSLDAWVKEQEEFQRTLFKPAFVQVHELLDTRDEEEEISEEWNLVSRVIDKAFPGEMEIEKEEE